MEWLDIIPDSVDINLSTFCQIVEDTEAWSAAAMESQREGRDVATIATHVLGEGFGLWLETEDQSLSMLISYGPDQGSINLARSQFLYMFMGFLYSQLKDTYVSSHLWLMFLPDCFWNTPKRENQGLIL